MGAICLLIFTIAVALGQGEPPRSQSLNVLPIDRIATVALPAIDAAALSEAQGQSKGSGPFQVAKAFDLSLTPKSAGTWERLPDGGRLWRVRVESLGALHLNFGFRRFDVPAGATLHILSAGDPRVFIGPYTHVDNSEKGLWTPMVPGNSVVIELYLPAGATQEPTLSLTRVGVGFR